MSLYNPIFVKFKFIGETLEGEYIPEWADYFSPTGCDNNSLTEPGFGYIRPFGRYYRQLNLNANMRMRKLDYQDWITLGDIVKCDAFVTDNRLCRIPNHLLIDDFAIVSREELTTNEKEILISKIPQLNEAKQQDEAQQLQPPPKV